MKHLNLYQHTTTIANRWSLILFLLLFSLHLSAQQSQTISGNVKDKSGESLIGVNILLKGTTVGTSTNVNGDFSIQAPINSILQFSYIGYKTQDIKIANSTPLLVTLLDDTENLEEVVVVGFGTQKKVNLTGAVGTVKTDATLKARPVTNVQELLAGSVPGLSVSKGTGAVGAAASMNIRGTSTIGGSSGVLVIIDGVPGNVYTLNPNDIESISVLKDAASAAIYGSRAANGVMLITTKAGKQLSDKPEIEFSSNIGFQNPQFKIDFVGAEDYMKLYDLAMINDGKEAFYGEQGLIDLRNGKYADNLWYKEIYKENTFINNNHLAINGNEKWISYRFAVSNDYQDGTLPNNTYQRYIIKPDLTIKLLKNLSFRANIQYTQTEIKQPQGGTDFWQSQATRNAPIIAIRENNGLYGVGGTMGGNPIAGVNESGYNKDLHKELFSIFELAYTPITNWNIKGNFSYYTTNVYSKSRSRTYYLYDQNGEVAKTQNPITGQRENFSSNYKTQLQILTDYSMSINEIHNFTFLAGYSQEYNYNTGFWASRDNMPFDGIDALNTGTENKQNGGNASDVAIMSVFGRINYNLNNKYLLEATLRTDGSSRFAKGHQWGVFPSFSGGWNINRESFMSNTESWLSELKIRASWGMLGDAEKVGYYPTAQVLGFDPKVYSFNGVLVGGAYNYQAVNPNITWERAKMTNIGIDFGVFNQRLRLSIDYFNNIRDNILYAPPVSTEFGLGAPLTNELKMKNQGAELQLSYNDQHNDFNWGADFTTSFTKNKVLNMGENEMWIEGNSITYLNDRYQLPYGYEHQGLFQNEDEIKNHAFQNGNVKPGNIKYKDQNEDGKIDGSDRIILSRKIPVHIGLNLRLGYKNFDFSINGYGRLNTLRYMSGYEGWAFYLSNNARPIHLDSWTESNPGASYPRLTFTNTANDTQYSDYWLRKSDMFKIQNVQLGYTFPTELLAKARIKYLRLFISGQNLATITGYDGFDPEGGYYPISRTFVFGLNFKF